MKKQSAKKKTTRDAAKRNGAKKGAAENGGAQKGGASMSSRLKSLTEGLSYQSESDYPVEPYARDAGKGAPAAAEFAEGREGEDAAVRELDFDSFFGNYTDEQDWWGDEEREVAKKFQALVKFLKASLKEIKVYRVGDVEADVYIVGKTDSGDFAGVKTKVVET